MYCCMGYHFDVYSIRRLMSVFEKNAIIFQASLEYGACFREAGSR